MEFGIVDFEEPIDIYSQEFQREQNSTWYHPYLYGEYTNHDFLTHEEIDDLAYEYYFRFLPFFVNQEEGSIKPNIRIDFSSRMKKKLGLTFLFERLIRLNYNYFCYSPINLPYTIFHEMTHIWLYDCNLDPSHTWRFYKKMEEFSVCMLPIDPAAHVHTRIAHEATNVYSCPLCMNRWFKKDQLEHKIFCGPCFDRTGEKYFAVKFNN